MKWRKKQKEIVNKLLHKKTPRIFPTIKCNYDGDTFAIYPSKVMKVKLKNYEMPFFLDEIIKEGTTQG